MKVSKEKESNGFESIILYSTHCPRCNVLEKKLNAKNIVYSEVNDEDVMQRKGYLYPPVLEVNGKPMDFATANQWINNN